MYSGGGAWFDVQPVIIESKLLGLLADWLNAFHIYGFTLVSGYIFQYLKYEKKRYQQFYPFIINKAKRLLVPYVFVVIIWIIPISYTLFSYTIKDIIIKYILCTDPSQLWFLWMLFDVFFLVWFLCKWIKNDFIAIIVSCLSWLIGFVCGAVFPNVFCIWTAFNYLPFFVLGMKLREKKDCFLYRVPNFLYVCIQVVLFCIYQITSSNKEFVFKLLSLVMIYSAHVFGALMSFFVLQWLATKVNWKNKLFRIFSKQSMAIYLFHQQIIYFTIIWLNGKVNPYLNAIVNFIVALVLSSLISTLLMRFKVTRVLIGEKK